jgi:hypothetical protein
MKTAKAMTILMVVAVVAMSASAREMKTKYDSRTDSGKVNYMMGLKSGNDGLTGSALMHLMILKIKSPKTDLKAITEAVNSLMIESPEASTRYKASLALQVFADPEWFLACGKTATEDVEAFYRNVAVRLQDKYFAGVHSGN